MSPEVSKYIRAIRNKEKKAYAHRYAQFILSGEHGTEPDRGSLSYMAAQGVRLQLHSLMRRQNPRGGKFDRCVREVTKRGGAYNPFAVCASRLKRVRRRKNPRLFTLSATAPNGERLKYVGGVKFSKHGAPALFRTAATAATVGRMLRLEFPVLKRYALRVHGL